MNERPYKKNNPHRFSISIVFGGIGVGIVSGCVTVIYRLLLNHAETLLFSIINYTKGHAFRIAIWLLILAILGVIVGKLIAWEGMSSGSGIPQVQGEMQGYLNQNWWKVLTSKIIGGTLCILGGLSLGREGPSVQLGAMAGKGLAKVTKQSTTKERIMITCGAGSGLAAAFNAPLAGVIFSLEEIQKNFNASILICAITGAASADFISKNVFGLSPVFHFQLEHVLTLKYYWTLILLGIVLGCCGALYNYIMLKGQDIYGKIPWIKKDYIIVIPFLISGILAYQLPSILAGGHVMIELITNHRLMMTTMVIFLIGKFIFSAICFGSGAPGGIFFPLLILGAYLGAIFGTIATSATALTPDYITNFIVLAMAGFFTAIVRAPITGIILIAEMTGTFEHFLSLVVVVVVSYVIAHLLGSEPIYESLLGRILAKKGVRQDNYTQEKVLASFCVGGNSIALNQKIKDVLWPDHCLIVTIHRGKTEIIAKGSTIVHHGDILVALVDEEYLGMVTESFQLICGEIQI